MKQIMAQVTLYKMAILIGVLFSINALSSSIVASFMNTEWSTLSGTSKFLLIVVILQGWTGTMLAFFNKTLGRIEAGKTPFDSGNTTTFTRPPQQPSPQPPQQ